MRKFDMEFGMEGITSQLASLQVTSTLLERIRKAQEEDAEVMKAKGKIGVTGFGDFRVGGDGIVRFRERVMVPNEEELRKEILREAHHSSYTIHPGSSKMYKDVKGSYWWPGMKEEIAKYVAECLVCQQVKAEHQRPAGQLQPLPVPEWKWERISMDFVSGLPRTRSGKTVIWVVVDRLTKSAHFLAIRVGLSLEQLAEVYIREIVRLHGVPASIVSDRDSRFVSGFWRSLQRAMGTTLTFSTAFHPQTDGQSERTIQTLEDLLRACVMDLGDSWDRHLPLVEFAYNNSYHASIRMAPYEALYGRKCRSPLYWDEVGERRLLGPELVRQAEEKVKVIRKHMKAAQDRQKSYADKRRRPLEFQVGEHVFLKISPTKGVMRFGVRGKLSPRYIGPFEISERVGEVAYRLALPPKLSGVHEVFHVSMLRRYLPNPEHVLDFERLELRGDLTYEEGPVRVMDTKLQVLRNRAIPFVKVVWGRHGDEEATWELEEDMRKKYPQLFDRVDE